MKMAYFKKYRKNAIWRRLSVETRFIEKARLTHTVLTVVHIFDIKIKIQK